MHTRSMVTACLVLACAGCSETARGDAGAGAGDGATPARVGEAPGPTCDLAIVGGTLFGISEGDSDDPASLWRLGPDGAEVVATATPSATWSGDCDLAIDGVNAWWRAGFAPEVRRTDLADGTTRVVDPTGSTGLTVGGGFAWWTRHGEGRVYRAPVDGDEGAPFADVETPTGVVADDTAVWVLERLFTVIWRFDIETAERESVATWLGDNTMTLFSGPNDLVWPSHSSGTLWAVAKSGGDPRDIGQGSAGQMSITSRDAYIAPHRYDFLREIRRAALDGSGTETLATVGEECSIGITADEDHVWWTDCDGAVWRAR